MSAAGSADVGARPLVAALPKGRILDETAAVFARAGYDLSPVFDSSRKLVYECGDLRVLVLRSSDVPAYVAHGAADFGVVGSDVLDEYGHDLYEPLDLGIGACRMIVAERAAQPVDARSQIHMCIATKYPKITRRYLEARGQTAEIIKLSGAIELAPLMGLADRIVDITQTGETLRQNGLSIVDTICEVSSRLVVNPASLKLHSEKIASLVSRLEQSLHEDAPREDAPRGEC
ncbi:ATP phosphoribosyltransferase [Haliangium ochraceum]|uniref:ATP phosphoribosyltransferase n=1 Tax=Haliangium ochraceum (strain DSM 14365 / JCM 11303 / SMP-2) TaxID=502025 RepID=D0LZH8_HALO1|nr:ATP phosphoribosyltransferase [Haliangium ochraceum]ACY17957.1 ATP phosphoribosyltransferase [Haliangium ochraceum DSM 14365]